MSPSRPLEGTLVNTGNGRATRMNVASGYESSSPRYALRLVWPRAEAEQAPDVEAVFRREGDMWSVRYGAGIVRMRDAKGMRYIAELLAHPGREFAALALAADGGDGAAARRGTLSLAADAGLAATGGDDIADVLDPRARAAYRQRLSDLEQQSEQSERFNDPERAARARAEIDWLTQELSAALGLGGRSRRTPGPAERARQSVTKAIRSSVRRLGEHDAQVGAHFTRAIRTGAVCCYDPDARARVGWTL